MTTRSWTSPAGAAFYGCLPRLLEQAGGGSSHVVCERAFFEDFARDMDTFQRMRREAMIWRGIAPEDLPATTYIQQPPCRRDQKIELQIYAVVPKSPGSVTVQTFYDEPTGTTAKLLTIGGHEHLYIAEINGVVARCRPAGQLPRAERPHVRELRTLLDRYGIKFPKVLRTWCYLDDIDRDYAEFNLSRNEFFAAEGVKRLPASTGIQARLWPAGALCRAGPVRPARTRTAWRSN